MSSKKALKKGIRVPLLLVLFTILIGILVPTVLAQPADPRDYSSEMPMNADLAYNLDAYFAVVNYNEPMNPWVQINYYYDNGSHIRMVFGIDRTIFPTLNLDFQNNMIQVFDRKGKLSGYGINLKGKTNLYIYVPM